MNLILDFAKEYGNDNYWKNRAKEEIDISCEIMKYFDKKIEINTDVLNMLLSGREEEAIELIFNDINFDPATNSGWEDAKRKAKELVDYLVPKYISNKENIKAQKRIRLLKELKELDKE